VNEKWQLKYLTIIVKPKQENQPQSGCSKLPKKYKEKASVMLAFFMTDAMYKLYIIFIMIHLAIYAYPYNN
jgi:hypothetical protein